MTAGGLEYVALAAAIAGAATTAYATYSSGQQQEQASKYNAKVLENQAEAARIASEERERQQREQVRRLQGRAAAAYGAAGVDLGSGSPLLVMADNARQAEFDILNEKYVAQARAAGAEAAAGLSEWEGRQARRAATIQAGGSLLASAGNIGTRYYGRSGLTVRPPDYAYP